MTKFIAFTALALSAATGTTAFAQEQGRVLSATPVIQQVAIPQQVCSNQMVYSQRQPSGAGALFGAVVGGLAGSAIGGGSGRAAATAIGMMGGSIVGNQVEAGPPGYRPMQTCGMQTTYQSQTVAYDVTYEYAGRRYTTRTQYDPGRWIPLSVQPMDQAAIKATKAIKAVATATTVTVMGPTHGISSPIRSNTSIRTSTHSSSNISSTRSLMRRAAGIPIRGITTNRLRPKLRPTPTTATTTAAIRSAAWW